MKKFTKCFYSLLLTAAGVLATSCQAVQVPESNLADPQNKREVTLSASYNTESKVALDMAWSSTWEEDDVIGGYTIGGTSLDEFNISDIASDAKSAHFTGEAGANVRFVYPMSDMAITNGQYTLELSGATMSGAAATTFTGAADDIILASTEVVDIEGGESSFIMQHQTAFAKLVFTASTNGDNYMKTLKINKVTIKGVGDFAGIPTSATLNLNLSSSDEKFFTEGSAGEYVLDMSESGLNVGTPMVEGLPATAVSAVIAVLPFELPSGQALEFLYEIELTSDSGEAIQCTYTQTKENTTDATLEFAKATYNTINLDIPYEEIEEVVEPEPITATVFNITETTADFIIEYDGTMALYVCSTDGTMTDFSTIMSQDPVTSGDSGATNTLTGLTPGTDYFLYPILRDNSNNYIVGEVVPFTTLAEVQPITATVFNITETTADCILEYDGQRAFYVCSTDGTMTDYQTVMSQGPIMAYGSGETIPLTDLSPSTDYYLYSIVMDYSNAYLMGEVVPFTTLGEASPITVTVSNITQTTADCVFEYESTGSAFYLCTTDGTLTDATTVLQSPGVGLAGASGAVTQVTGLTANTLYYIYPLLPNYTTSPATYELGKIESFTTLQEENAQASISVEVSGVTSTHADFTFTYENTDLAYFYCSTEKLDSYVSTDVTYAYGKQMITPYYASGELYSYYLTLEKSTTYYVYTTACNDKGEYVVGERVEFTTLEEDPTYAITAAISNVTHNSADCIFTYETSIGCYVVTTEAGLTDATYLYQNYTPVMITGSGVTTTIDGLEQMTKYYVYPIAVGADMSMTLGKVENFTTQPEPVEAVTSIGGQAVNVTATSADVIITYANSQAQYYLFTTDGTLSDVYDIMSNGSKVMFNQISGSSVSFSNLTAMTDYFVYTAAIDMDGSSMMGTTIKFTTLADE